MDMRVGAVAFEKYYDLLKACAPRLTGMIVYDAHTRLLWANSDCNLPGATIACLAHDEESFAFYRASDGKQYRSYHYGIEGVSGARIARLLLVVDYSDGGQCNVLSDSNANSIAAVVEVIRSDFRAQEEIDSLALELAERYEELNLIYHTDDQISDYSTGQKAIKNIVEQCIRHLDIDMALLAVPGKGIFTAASAPDSSIADAAQEMEKLQDSLLDYLSKAPQRLVINSAQEAAQLKLNTSVAYKLVCSPIAFGNNQASGVIALLKGAEKSNFTNSHRNLLGVLERKVAKIIQQSYDKLTGLLNWASFQHILAFELSNAAEQQQSCLLMLDVNQLHVVNDLGGFQAGDALLIEIAELLSAKLKGYEIIARQSGDVFVALLRGCDVTGAELLAQELRRSVNAMGFSWQQEAFRININIGITPVEHGATAKTVISAAEHALAVSGERGINRIEINRVSNAETSARKNRIAWVNRVHEALRNDRFNLHCQAVYATALQTTPHHYEILVRMCDQQGGFVAPNNFIPAAEYYKIMPELDRWVIRKALQTLHEEWDTLRHLPQSFAINLSGQTFSDPYFKDFIVSELKNSTIPTSRFGFEVTETATVEKLADAKALLKILKSFGCEIYLDDFGTGLSSFAYLKSLPFDYLKIDGSFIKQITEDPVSEGMVVAIRNMAQVTGLETIAEFVENQEIIACLEKIGIDYLQGYGLHAPESISKIFADLKSGQPE